MEISLENMFKTLDLKVDGEIGNVVGKLDESVVLGHSFTGSGSNRYLRLATKNLKTGTTSVIDVQIPIASETESGWMNSELVVAILNAFKKIEALEGATTTWPIDLTGAVDDEKPTQQELQAAYETASSESGDAPEGTRIFHQDTGREWRWFGSTKEWVLMTVPQVSGATNFSPGITQGTPSDINAGQELNDGKIYVEADLTMSVLGWSGLKARVTNIESGVSTLNTKVGALETGMSTLGSELTTAKTKISALESSVGEIKEFVGDESDFGDLIAKWKLEGYWPAD